MNPITIDLCVDMCTDMCMDLCVEMCMDMCIHAYRDMCIDTCTGTVAVPLRYTVNHSQDTGAAANDRGGRGQ